MASKHTRRTNIIFTPAKLRNAAGERFRSVDYSYHCELGGHPVPTSWKLLNDSEATAQLMLSDCLGHTGRIWDHTVRWAEVHTHGDFVLRKRDEMLKHYKKWKKVDLLTRLPPPPSTFPDQ